MKDMGPLHYCRGVSVIQNMDGIWLHQKLYILSLLRKFGLMDAKPASTPADPNVRLVKDDSVSKQLEDKALYQSMVGSSTSTFNDAAMVTQPDIAQAVGAVSKFCAQPTEAHLTAVKRVALLEWYQRFSTLIPNLRERNHQLVIQMLIGPAAMTIDTLPLATCSFMEVVQLPGQARSKLLLLFLPPKPNIIIALSAAAQEAAWLQKLLLDLRMPSQPIVMMEDNQGAKALAKNPIAHSRTKYHFHFIRDTQENGLIQIKFCPTEEMLAYLLTKPLPRNSFEKLRQLLGMEFV